MRLFEVVERIPALYRPHDYENDSKEEKQMNKLTEGNNPDDADKPKHQENQRACIQHFSAS
jgi:hypothetical protein